MANFLRYALRETFSNLWRNRLMTMAAVLTVTVSLGLVGSALYLKQGAAQASADWERQTQVIVFMNATASKAQIDYVGQQLASSHYVTQCGFYPRLWDYREMLQLLPRSETFTLKPATTPSSWRCIPAKPALATLVVNEFGASAWYTPG